jgi:hypothetical protein
VRVIPVICFIKNPAKPSMPSPHVTGSVASHHAFLGCAYFERFHNQKIKAYFRETVYAETRERIVINWVLNKVSKRSCACLSSPGLVVSDAIPRAGNQGQPRICP